MAMADCHRTTLRSNRVYLVQNIHEVLTVLQHLVGDKILTVDMMESILAKPTRSEKVVALLDILPKRGCKAFDRFVWALAQSGLYDCAKALDPQFVCQPPKPETELERERRLRLRAELKIQCLERRLAVAETQRHLNSCQDMTALYHRRLAALERYKREYDASHDASSCPPRREGDPEDELDS
mgnify:CR=1 FL=1